MHDTRTAGVDLKRSEIELLIELLANAFATVQGVDKVAAISSLYDKLASAKKGL